MTNEIVKYTPQQLAVVNYHGLQRNAKLSDRITGLLQIEDVEKALTREEKKILSALTKKPISQYREEDAVKIVAVLFKSVSMDIGYRFQNDPDWQYKQTRMFDFLLNNFADFSAESIRQAFDTMLSYGLDDYLPKNSKGEPNREHYQNFNTEYLSRILTAYRRKITDVHNKAVNAVPPPVKQVTAQENAKMHDNLLASCIVVYLRYKYTGKLVIPVWLRLVFVADWLQGVGYDVDATITEEDRQRSIEAYKCRILGGLVPRIEGTFALKEGFNNAQIANTASNIALRNAIQSAFDEMIEDEINIIQYTQWKYYRTLQR